MDIFNRRRVEELEKENAILKRRLDEYMSRATKAENALDELSELKNERPEDCTPGSYCEACEFVKTFYYLSSWTGNSYIAHYCGKGKSCTNFIQKKVEEPK